MTNAQAAYGTLLKMGDGGSPENFSTVAEITDLSLPKFSLSTDDATNHDGTGWDESVATILSGGEPSFKADWITSSASQNETTGVLAAMLNRTKKNWKIVLPNAAKTFSFAAYVTKFEPSANVKNKLDVSFSLKITGPVTVS